MLYKIRQIIYEQTLCKNLQNTDKNKNKKKNISFGVCTVNAAQVYIFASVQEKKKHFEKTAFKGMYFNLQMHIDKVL